MAARRLGFESRTESKRKMKLGVAGLLGEATRADALRVREMGFGCASWLPASLENISNREYLLEVRDNLEAEDLDLCQLLPPQYPSFVHPDAAVRREGVDAMRRCVDASVTLGAGNLYVRPGSVNTAGPWTPHPENHRHDTRQRLIESLRELAPHAEAAGVPLAIEAHVVSPLHTPEVVREVLDQVGSPILKFNADPVNLIRSIDLTYDNTAFLHELFDLLGPEIVTAHVKDVTVLNRLVVHIEEVVPGQGHLDIETFLRRFDDCCPQGAVLIEHLPAEKVPEARRAVLEFAARAGLTFN
jgi:sugar phosphate isomerase/epimerase